MSLLLEDFNYHLPEKLIAQKPVKPRDHSRLLLLNKENGEIDQLKFFNILDFLKSGDVLVLNNSKVFPARIIARKKTTGGVVEVFLHKKIDKNTWECLLKGKVNQGLELELAKNFFAKVLTKNEDGTFHLSFNLSGDKFWSMVNKIGETPLPPYIKRDKKNLSDKKNYQTVFASDKKIGSVAAPTAGLHLTDRLLNKIKEKGIEVVNITLHVGLGTFSPVKTEKILEHKMHSEFVEIKSLVIKKIVQAKKEKRRIISLGTTSCRALESFNWNFESKQFKTESFWTDIFIYPGYKFKIVDALITNFHLPKSSLLMLITALAGAKNIKKAYSLAIKENYRFFSYGDAMFIY